MEKIKKVMHWILLTVVVLGCAFTVSVRTSLIGVIVVAIVHTYFLSYLAYEAGVFNIIILIFAVIGVIIGLSVDLHIIGVGRNIKQVSNGGGIKWN